MTADKLITYHRAEASRYSGEVKRWSRKHNVHFPLVTEKEYAEMRKDGVLLCKALEAFHGEFADLIEELSSTIKESQ